MCAVIILGSPRTSYLGAGGDCRMSEELAMTLSGSYNNP